MPVFAQEIIISTGSEGGSYNRLGIEISDKIKSLSKGAYTPKVIQSYGGSGMNIDRFNAGEAHIVIVQSDALSLNKPIVKFRAKKAHLETVWWLYNKEHGVSDLSDAEGNEKDIIAMVEDSGSMFTLKAFVAADSGYKANYDNFEEFETLYDAVDAVCDGEYDGSRIIGTIYVGGSLPKDIKDDFSECVMVGQATDGDFDDFEDVNGNQLFEDCSIASSEYTPMSGSNSFSDEDTVCVSAMVVYSEKLPKKAKRIVKKAINKLLNRKQS